MGESVIAARESRAAIISLTLANQRAMADVMFLNESVVTAAVGAVQMVDGIYAAAQATPAAAEGGENEFGH